MPAPTYIQVILPLRLEWEPCYRVPEGIEVQVGDRVRLLFAKQEYIGTISAVDAGGGDNVVVLDGFGWIGNTTRAGYAVQPIGAVTKNCASVDFAADIRSAAQSTPCRRFRRRRAPRIYASWTRFPVTCSGTRAKTSTAAPASWISFSMAASSIGKRRQSLRQMSSAAS